MEKQSITNKLIILDCTLRDGGYYTNWDFDESLVDNYLSAMNKLPIDIIEIGYKSPPKENYAGGHFYLPDFLIERIKKQTKKDLAIILNEKDVRTHEVEDLLTPCIEKVKLIRLAVAPQNFLRGIELADRVKNLGFEVAFNLMYASKWETEFPKKQQLELLNKTCDYFYVVDSYGGLFPQDIKTIFNYLKSGLTIPLGFHGHNNLEMALANSLEAINCGVQIIDATIDGMGRGAGNLKTELLLSVLYQRGTLEIDFDILIKIVEHFLKLKPKYNWGTNLAYMVSGSFSLPQNKVMEQVNKRYFSLNDIVREVTAEIDHVNKKLSIEVFKPTTSYSNVLIIGGGESAEIHKAAIHSFLKSEPEIPIIFASSKNSIIFRGIKNPQIHLIPGKELQRLKDYLSPEEIKNRSLVGPPSFEIFEDFTDLKFFKLSAEENYHFPGSVTEYCLKVAKAFKAERIYLIGYDGYGNLFNKAQKELFEENEIVFKHYLAEDFKIKAITPSEYNIENSSIYSFF
ncbi:aldolase catalytic domain-containing protein [Salegentibacter sp. LM13S]|uniref:aldolase catalytic domain-containing protein n=1 Tax=Salegentibacter lacus TaxID=2873599 RepID=UPI001CCCA83B|nr:aldolase catalytic domain-containing protein [Salegentibacter lacus]MBZ9631475.1 aldolase catalytic domain-containing protein [Salegentibacter lacus]